MNHEHSSDVVRTDSTSASETDVVEIRFESAHFGNDLRTAADVLAAGRAVAVISGCNLNKVLAYYIHRVARASCSVQEFSNGFKLTPFTIRHVAEPKNTHSVRGRVKEDPRHWVELKRKRK
jgi:hypothetical protein